MEFPLCFNRLLGLDLVLASTQRSSYSRGDDDAPPLARITSSGGSSSVLDSVNLFSCFLPTVAY